MGPDYGEEGRARGGAAEQVPADIGPPIMAESTYYGTQAEAPRDKQDCLQQL